MFDLDRHVSRIGTDAIKWDVAGEGVIPMWVADMEFPVPPAVQKAIADRAAHGIFGYSSIPENWAPAYAAWWKKRHGVTIQEDWLLFCPGIVPAITSILRRTTHPGEKVLVMPPVYHMFFHSVMDAGCQVLNCPLSYEDAAYSIDWDAMEKGLADPLTTAMILCNPHNPSGNIWTKEELARLGEMCRKYHVLPISDEIHCDLTAPGIGYVPFASASETCRDISVTCIAPSKAFNLAGLQTAAVFAADPLLREKIAQGLHADGLSMPNAFACIAAAAALEEGGEWLDELRAYLWQNRAMAESILKEKLPEARVIASDATYLLWLDCTAFTHDSDALTSFLQHEAGVLVNSGMPFGPGGEGFLRINLAAPADLIREGTERIVKGIRAFSERK